MFYIQSSICDLLFSRYVALAYGGAVHFGYLHIVLNLYEIQSQVHTTNSHECAALPGTPQRCDLLKVQSGSIIL